MIDDLVRQKFRERNGSLLAAFSSASLEAAQDALLADMRVKAYLGTTIHSRTETPETIADERASFLAATFITLANLPLKDNDRGIELAGMMQLKHEALYAPPAIVEPFLDAIQEYAIRLKGGFYSAKLS